ncbi:hypothetical protein BT96DRAFT_1003247 [Gymnopus androsaceus JB14]|uniref:G domain-containing protein n=1 Tax=Gymnopus androsaceus JB14 TaxID=1447944 RepID=A0A6A4GVD7_9AGAR|nr:hypothetical protein BT96DRAFT_1003247 [Gymnopus androsaceus JB14]
MSEIRRFRLLIIGKTGCGKTTILSKVCGEDADRPSTTRGVHDIDRELRFQHNNRLVAHDSEGFEAGQRTELGVVNNFIERRATMEDINERLHMVWYCRRDEFATNTARGTRVLLDFEERLAVLFGGVGGVVLTSSPVPVIVVITKFDAFVRDVLQELEEAADEEGLDMDEDELEKQAVQVAKNRFNECYRPQLQDLPQPPKAIVALSNTNESQPNDSRLSELIKQTMVALDPPNDPNITPGQRNEQHKLRELFVTAQTADLTVKVFVCRSGMGDNYKKLGARPIDRKRLVEPWNTIWSYTHPQTLFAWLDYQLQRHIDYSPRILGHPDSHDLQEIWQWRRELQLSAQLEHMVIHLPFFLRYAESQSQQIA